MRKPIFAQRLTPWLVDEASLTKRLQARYDDFNVQPLLVQHDKPLHDEKTIMGVREGQRAFVREVLLYGDNSPVVFAHSVVALKQLRGSWAGLASLGKKPLGAALFAKPNLKRTNLVCQKLAANHPLRIKAQQAIMTSGLAAPKGAMWARRSIFSLNSQMPQHTIRIMVTEVFLPTLLSQLHNEAKD